MQTPRRSDLLPLLAGLNGSNFEAAAQAVFRYQAAHNPLFSKYLKLRGADRNLQDSSFSAHSRNIQTGYLSFLPISFFKTQLVQAGDWNAEAEFRSSGTTGQKPSRHLVRHLDFYLENAFRGFAHCYGDPSEWAVLALLPSYLERGNSSLVAMADFFIKKSAHAESGFFLNDFDKLETALKSCQSKGRKTLLLGVSFALLDLAEQSPMDLRGITLMETGGMKGRRKEITRTELHETLKAAFGVEAIHSEYGMTELFSQAYSTGDARFHPAPTMRVLVTELNDPFCAVPQGKTGVLNIIDLANLDTCSFVQTEDLGRVFADGSFEVLGRADAAEMRGCNLMVVVEEKISGCQTSRIFDHENRVAF